MSLTCTFGGCRNLWLTSLPCLCIYSLAIKMNLISKVCFWQNCCRALGVHRNTLLTMVICHATSLCSQSHHIHFSLGKMQKMSFSWGSTVPLLKFLMFFVGLLPSCPVTEILDFSCMWCSGLDMLNCLGLECVYSNCIILHPIANKAGACAPPSSIPIMILCKRMTVHWL